MNVEHLTVQQSTNSRYMTEMCIIFTFTKEKLNFDILIIFYDANFGEHTHTPVNAINKVL